MQKITMMGTGYVGLVTGACLADFGNRVICVDTDAEKIEALERGKLPFYEFSLGEVVARNVAEGRLSFTTDLPGAIRASKVIFIAVGTPTGEGGEADLAQVFSAARTIAANMNGYKLVVQKSTVPVGTGERVLRTIEGLLKRKKMPFDVASNPEFLREGSAVEDFMRPDRVVIGTWSKKAEAILSEIYRPLYLSETPMVKTSVQTAELIKYAQQRVPRDEDLLHQRDGEPLRGPGRRRQDGGQGDGAGQADRPEVPPRRARLRRLLLPQGHAGAGESSPARRRCRAGSSRPPSR